ncbi:hypothetical protein [Shewanella gelidii]|uniref:Rap1a immunity protein domain-containing protein n=1 Tax=Shewanella gelidii TaxID=1642821 RepID=A0A917JT87_9GAMM|nr:hypothetical protein [Shewanella gelidii]MCL1098413.1 hypothetical protein [Shewanella gelidii]GGI82921.1 hypothetical protein GCM10009332_20250 [Shewanella gelidii]
MTNHKFSCQLIKPVSAMLLLSLSSIASAGQFTEGSSPYCKASYSPNAECTEYVRGYLDALLQLSPNAYGGEFSSFEKRALRTRAGTNIMSNSIRRSYNLCLPDEVDVDDVLSSRDENLPLQRGLLQALKTMYPCKT